jgi:DNA-binding response OmpR family regulator
MGYKVLYIEDEEHLASIVKETLELNGFTVLHFANGMKVLEAMYEFQPDICVLDVMLPFLNGFRIGSSIRATHPEIPIIFLTAKSQTSDVLEGFTVGGNDYLKKPFSMEELIVRIKNLISIKQNVGSSQPKKINKQMRLGNFNYYPEKMELVSQTNTIKLSNRETEILNIFALHLNEAIDRKYLMQVVWGDDSYFISRNLDVYIRRLRDYFAQGEGVEIITLKGKGYHFSVDAQS